MKKILLSEVQIDFASPVPVYEQIKKNIKQAIARKIIKEKENLPSIRELATFLRINPNTVARAYRELSHENIIEGRAGKGFWVAEIGDLHKESIKLVQEEFLKLLEKAVEMGITQKKLKEMILDFFTEKK